MSSPPRIKAACVWAAAPSALGSLLGSQLKWQMMMHSLGEHAAHMDTRLFKDSKHTREGKKNNIFSLVFLLSPVATGNCNVFIKYSISESFLWPVLCSLYLHTKEKAARLLNCKRSKLLLLRVSRWYFDLVILLKFSKEETAEGERFQSMCSKYRKSACWLPVISDEIGQFQAERGQSSPRCWPSPTLALSIFHLKSPSKKKTTHFVCKSLLHCLCLCLILLYLGTTSVICVLFLEPAYSQTEVHAHIRPSVSSTQTWILPLFERWTHLKKTNLHASPAAAPSCAAGTVIAVAVLPHSRETNCSFVFFICLTRLRNREATRSQHLVRWRTSGLLTCLPVAGSSAVHLHFLTAYVACL